MTIALCWLSLNIGFYLGCLWHANRVEAQERQRSDEMWQLVKGQIKQERDVLDRAEAHARFLPKRLREQKFAARN